MGGWQLKKHLEEDDYGNIRKPEQQKHIKCFEGYEEDEEPEQQKKCLIKPSALDTGVCLFGKEDSDSDSD